MLEISVVPVGTGTPSVSGYVAGAVRELEKAAGVRWRLTPMGTVVEGELENLLRLALKMHRSVFASGAERVVTTIKIDERVDRRLTMAGKLSSVEEKLARKNNGGTGDR